MKKEVKGYIKIFVVNCKVLCTDLFRECITKYHVTHMMSILSAPDPSLHYSLIVFTVMK